MQTDIYMMNINMNNKIIAIFFLLTITSCSLAPGMHMSSSTTWLDDEETIFIESINKEIKILNIYSEANTQPMNKSYLIGIGDQIAITIWGLPEIFPITNINPDSNLRRVDSNGNIFFPYVGAIQASGKTQYQLREDLTFSLSKFFNNPQVDISIARFNSQNFYILGEVTKPQKININDIPISLADAVGEALGLNTNTSKGSDVFIIRHYNSETPKIYRADLSSPAGFIAAGEFYIKDNDIIYVNASGTARWNKVISQFFPFSTFLNSVDNLTSSD